MCDGCRLLGCWMLEKVGERKVFNNNALCAQMILARY
jgi:hypothetical protein